MRRTLTTFTTLALTLAALAAGCTTPAQTGADTRASAQTTVTTIKVVNQAFLDMNVFVVSQGGGRQRLGTATGNSTTVLTIPSRILFGATTLGFVADPIGGSHAEVSTSIVVNPGDQVVMTIPPQ